MKINTEHLDRCIGTLRSAWEGLQEYEPEEMHYRNLPRGLRQRV